MTITIELAPEIPAHLREKAALEGQEVEVVAASILTDALEWDAEDPAQPEGGEDGTISS